MKVALYRGFRTNDLFKDLVGEYEGKVVDLLKNGEYNVHYRRAFLLKTI
jgi:hypothetical protein